MDRHATRELPAQHDSAASAEDTEPLSRRGKWGVGILLALILLVASTGWFVGPLTCGYLLQHSRPLPGPADRLDPVAVLPAVSAFAGPGVRLLEIRAAFVRSDGTLDLTARSYRPEVRYEFAREAPPPDDAPPIGAGGAAQGAWEEQIRITLSRPWEHYSVRSGWAKYDAYELGMRRRAGTGPATRREVASLPPPVCSFRDLWRAAEARGAPANAVATIRYDASGYRFEIPDVHVDLSFDPRCQLTSR